MSVIFAIFVYIALHVVPAGTEAFQVVDPAGRMANGQPIETVMEFTRQPDGAWRMVKERRGPSMTFALNGKTLIVTLQEDERKPESAKSITMDIADAIRVGPETDWATVSEFLMPNGGKVTLAREPGRVTVDLTAGAEADARKNTFQIRWKAEQ